MTKVFTKEQDLQLVSQVVRKAGEIALEALKKSELKNWLKKGREPVTEIDLLVNDFLRKALTNKRPDYGWLSEESSDDLRRLNLRNVWVVDPIDGTRALLEKKDDFSICVALLEDRKPVVSAIFAPARDEFFLAQKGAGATLNNKPIRVSNTNLVDGMRLQGDENYFDCPKRWQSPWENINFHKFRSFALRIAAVAAGTYDGAISARPKSEWDVAAADLIITEAGGVCCDQNGVPLSYNNQNTRLPQIIATNSVLKDQIIVKLNGRLSKNTS